MEKLDYNVISSGSKGNAVRIGNILIDAGVPFKKLGKDIYMVDYLLITHTHTDHLKESTVSKIRETFPHIKIIGNHEVAYTTKVHEISNHSLPMSLGKWTVTPFPCIHDVITQGFVIEDEHQRIIYATDTAGMENAPPGPYDYFFLESNHDEKKIKPLQGNYSKYGYNVYMSAQRHLSTQQAKAFYYMHRRDKDSPWIELHKSHRFY